MSPIQEKPIIHGRDHSPGGADPIPGLDGGGIDFDTYPQDGQWLYVETTGPDTSPSGVGIEVNDSGGNGISLDSGTGPTTSIGINEYGSNEVSINNHESWFEKGGDTYIGGDATTVKGKTVQLSSNVVGSGRLTQIDSPDQVLIQGGIAPSTITLEDATGITLTGGGGAGTITLYSSDGYYGAIFISAGAQMKHQMVAAGGVYGGLSDPGQFFTCPAGYMFQVWDGVGGSPMLRVNHSSGGVVSYHIKSGASWVADL